MKSESALPMIVALALVSTVGYLVYRESRIPVQDNLLSLQRDIFHQQVQQDRIIVAETSRILTHVVIDAQGRKTVHKGTASDLDWMTHYGNSSSQTDRVLQAGLDQQARENAAEIERQTRMTADQENNTAKTARADYDTRMNVNSQYGMQQKNLQVHLKRIGDEAEDRAEVSKAQRQAQKKSYEGQLEKSRPKKEEPGKSKGAQAAETPQAEGNEAAS